MFAREFHSFFSYTASYFLLDERFSALTNNCCILLVITTAVPHCLYFKTSTWMSPVEAEQINMCVHLCKYLSKTALLKVPVNLRSKLLCFVSLQRQSHHQTTVAVLHMGDFIAAFPLEDYLGDSLPIEEVG